MKVDAAYGFGVSLPDTNYFWITVPVCKKILLYMVFIII